MWKKRLANYSDEEDDCQEQDTKPNPRESVVFRTKSCDSEVSDMMTPYFGNRASVTGSDVRANQKIEKITHETLNYSQIAPSIPEIIKKYRGQVKEIVNEEEFNTICQFLEIDNAESFDSLIYEYYSKLYKNIYKLNGKVIRSLKESKIEEYELKIKLSSARIKIETLTEMEFGSDLSS